MIGTAKLGGAVLFFWYYGSPEYTDVGYQPDQPIDYSHKFHVGTLGLDCRYCHSFIETSYEANIPSTETCMNCHQNIQKDSEELDKLKASWNDKEPIEWVKVHMLPDYAYFNHSVHLNVGQRLIDSNNNGKWDKGEPGIAAELFFDCNSDYSICEGDVDWEKSMGNGKWDFEDLDDNGICDYELKFDKKSKAPIWETFNSKECEPFEDEKNNIWDKGEPFEDIIGNGRWDEGEEFVDGESFTDKNNNGRWDDAEDFVDLNGNGKCDKRNIMFMDQLPGVEIAERKTVYMDYVTKIDTLSVDSLYSSIQNFRHNYTQNDLFLIDVTRFENDLIKLHIEDELGFKATSFSSNNEGPSELLAEEYKKERFYFNIPFLANSLFLDLYYKEKEEKDVVISSPIPKNENWQYWQKINYSDQNYFSVPTPFWFYTGDHGNISNNEKSWVE